jgi:hypothetical protein
MYMYIDACMYIQVLYIIYVHIIYWLAERSYNVLQCEDVHAEITAFRGKLDNYARLPCY